VRPVKGPGSGRIFAAGLLAACALSGGLALAHLETPGLYYDEVIQATPAVAFLEGEVPSAIPGRTQVRLGGRWLPLMTQPYMGALKSQALIPAFALFGAGKTTLRATTWLWTLLGIAFAMLLARELLGTAPAVLAGLLLALDPSVLFVGRHDWGSFALGLLCRCAGLWLLVVGWRKGGLRRLAGGGALLGLGLYNKLDFAAVLAAAAAALALTAPHLWRKLRLRHALAVGGGLTLGALPVLLALPGAFAAGRLFASRAGANPAWREKAIALMTTLDGSYFHRLMLSGGSFEELGKVEGAASGPFPLLLVAAALFLGVRLVRAPRDEAHEPGRRFVLAASLLALLAIFLTPRAVRIHHVLNAVPFPQLLVAAALTELWRLGTGRIPLRALAAALAGVALLGSARVDARTLATLDETGGKGRWSDALDRLATSLPAESRVVALDWGFAEPLRFLTPERPVEEIIWRLRGPRRVPLVFDGDAHTVYLLHQDRLAVFEHGAAFLRALEALPEGTVQIEPQRDRVGDTAFLAVRIAKPHRFDYRRSLEVRLR
jgi:hypothetical protein